MRYIANKRRNFKLLLTIAIDLGGPERIMLPDVVLKHQFVSSGYNAFLPQKTKEGFHHFIQILRS